MLVQRPNLLFSGRNSGQHTRRERIAESISDNAQPPDLQDVQFRAIPRCGSGAVHRTATRGSSAHRAAPGYGRSRHAIIRCEHPLQVPRSGPGTLRRAGLESASRWTAAREGWSAGADRAGERGSRFPRRGKPRRWRSASRWRRRSRRAGRPATSGARNPATTLRSP
jgi:hypothetical protein